MLVIFSMLVPLSSAVAADEPISQPTIEEILNGYHEKAFAAQTAEENGGASTYARGGTRNSQTLEHETVAELTAAGYEAYNVTGDNYEALEETLHTDFAEMGLDPNSSYVVVVSGNLPSEPQNPNARAVHPTFPENFDGDASGFLYTEDGITYTMRYVTVTSADAYSELFKEKACMLSDVDYADEIGSILIEYTLDIACEKVIQEVLCEVAELIPYVGTICSLISLVADVQEAVSTDPFTIINHDTLVFFSATAWTRRYIQVYDSVTGYWQTTQCSSYAVSKAHFDGGYYYDPIENKPKELIGIIKNTTTYSPYYSNAAQYQTRAVEGYKYDCILYDCTGNIDFYLSNPNGDNPLWREIYLFTHQESSLDLIPFRENE